MIKDKILISLTIEYIDNIIMYGIEARHFGKIHSFSSLTSNRNKIEEFISTLNRNNFNIDILPELVDDFLEDLYGE